MLGGMSGRWYLSGSSKLSRKRRSIAGGDWFVAGHAVPPITPVGEARSDATTEEIDDFTERAQAAGCRTISFWEWVASTDAQWFAVAELATASAPAEPPAPPKPEPPAGTEPGVSWEQVAVYGQWAIARVANREEPRDRGTFGVHIVAGGSDERHLRRYEWPG